MLKITLRMTAQTSMQLDTSTFQNANAFGQENVQRAMKGFYRIGTELRVELRCETGT